MAAFMLLWLLSNTADMRNTYKIKLLIFRNRWCNPRALNWKTSISSQKKSQNEEIMRTKQDILVVQNAIVLKSIPKIIPKSIREIKMNSEIYRIGKPRKYIDPQIKIGVYICNCF